MVGWLHTMMNICIILYIYTYGLHMRGCVGGCAAVCVCIEGGGGAVCDIVYPNSQDGGTFARKQQDTQSWKTYGHTHRSALCVPCCDERIECTGHYSQVSRLCVCIVYMTLLHARYQPGKLSSEPFLWHGEPLSTHGQNEAIAWPYATICLCRSSNVLWKWKLLHMLECFMR